MSPTALRFWWEYGGGVGGVAFLRGRCGQHSGKVAQPAHRVKDKRLRRAFGIPDTARRLGFMVVKGLLPTSAKQG